MYGNDVDCVKIRGTKVIGDNSYYERAMKLRLGSTLLDVRTCRTL